MQSDRGGCETSSAVFAGSLFDVSQRLYYGRLCGHGPQSRDIRSASSEMQVLVAVDRSGEAVGTIAYKADKREGHIRGMAVRPLWQGRGVAEKLVLHSFRQLQQGCSILRVVLRPFRVAPCVRSKSLDRIPQRHEHEFDYVRDTTPEEYPPTIARYFSKRTIISSAFPISGTLGRQTPVPSARSISESSVRKCKPCGFDIRLPERRVRASSHRPRPGRPPPSVSQ